MKIRTFFTTNFLWKEESKYGMKKSYDLKLTTRVLKFFIRNINRESTRQFSVNKGFVEHGKIICLKMVISLLCWVRVKKKQLPDTKRKFIFRSLMSGITLSFVRRKLPTKTFTREKDVRREVKSFFIKLPSSWNSEAFGKDMSFLFLWKL